MLLHGKRYVAQHVNGKLFQRKTSVTKVVDNQKLHTLHS